jgi:iron(III) transport system ATP-binding protein
MVFQDLALWPHMTARQHLEFVLPAARWSEAIPAWLERVGLAGRASARPGQLSGGERQRLALARALAPGPRLLLLDEPFKSLDEPLAERLGVLVKELAAAAGATTLMVSHARLQALELCDTLAFLWEGEVAVSGPAGTMLSPDAPAPAREFFAGTEPIRDTRRNPIGWASQGPSRL